ncbi:MAG: NAD(P)/FAD-dependent oxidoreductase [Actinomycetota bacterium]
MSPPPANQRPSDDPATDATNTATTANGVNAETADPTEARVDVAVVGAGIGGLAVAAELTEQGESVTVLESRDRVGGRLRTHHTSEGPLDLGATWFWPNEPRINALIERLGLSTHAQYVEGAALFQNGDGGRQRFDGNPLGVASGRFGEGAASLTRALADRLPDGVLTLGAPVSAVIGDGPSGPLRVVYDTGAVVADRVVLALPPALAVHRIRFAPALPPELAQLAAATPVWMASVAKVVVRYERPFWRSAGLAGAAISHRGPMREIHDMSGPDGRPAALFGFAPLSADGPVPQQDPILAQLVELFGPEAADPVEVLIAPWRDEPDTAPPGAADLNAYQTYGHRLYQQPTWDGRLLWASTETGHDAPGHIEGALAAAERTVAHLTRGVVS